MKYRQPGNNFTKERSLIIIEQPFENQIKRSDIISKNVRLGMKILFIDQKYLLFWLIEHKSLIFQKKENL